VRFAASRVCRTLMVVVCICSDYQHQEPNMPHWLRLDIWGMWANFFFWERGGGGAEVENRIRHFYLDAHYSDGRRAFATAGPSAYGTVFRTLSAIRTSPKLLSCACYRHFCSHGTSTPGAIQIHWHWHQLPCRLNAYAYISLLSCERKCSGGVAHNSWKL